jgi:ketosteroid isomerase-like protein
MSRDRVELTRRALEAISTGGAEAALDLGVYTEDVRIYPTSEWPDDEVYCGHSGFRSLYSAWADNFDDLGIEVQQVRDVGGQVVSLFEWRGRLKDSGMPLREPWGSVTDFRDGFISEVRLFRSQRQALEAVGLREEA